MLLLSPIRLYGNTASRPRFSELCLVAVGWVDRAIMSLPAASADGPRIWVWLAVSVLGSGGIFGMAVLIWLTRALSVFSSCAAFTVTGNRACIATMSVTGSVTFHWVSWAFSVV